MKFGACLRERICAEARKPSRDRSTENGGNDASQQVTKPKSLRVGGTTSTMYLPLSVPTNPN
jgi:hypothetical protein